MLRIENCECVTVSRRYEPEQVWEWPGGRYEGWTSVFVRVTDADGLTGYGEIGDGLNTPEIVPVVFERAARLVRGMPAEPRQIVDRLTRSAPGWGHGGLFASVIGGIEMAVLDLMGKALGVPAASLLGGAFRTELPVYASGGISPDEDEIRAEVREHVAAGFDAVKIRVGYEPDLDVRRVRAAREELGPDRDLMLDLGASFLPNPPDVQEVLALADRFEPYDPYWLEEPLPREDIEGHVALRSRVAARIATGENERSPDQIRRMLEAGAVDVVQTDAVYVGGILRQLEIAQYAQACGARVAPHSWCSGPGLMANITVVATAPAGLVVEMPRVPNPLRERTLAAPLIIRDGRLRLPEAPGLNVMFDDEVLSWGFDPDAGPRLATAGGS